MNVSFVLAYTNLVTLQVRNEALRILREGNEDPQAFRVFSPYRVIEVHRPG